MTPQNLKIKSVLQRMILLEFLFILAFAGGGKIEAAESDSPKSTFRRWAEQDYMLGDWGGLRTNLSHRGVDFEFFYAGTVPNNLAGGIQLGGVYQGALLMGVDLDSEKLAGYRGGTLHVSGLWLHGRKPFSDAYSGDLNKVNLIDFPNAARFWEVWYQQKILEGKLALKLGKLSVDRDFIVPEYYNSLGQVTLLNQTFFYPSLAFNVYDMPGMPSRNHGLASTPAAAPGAILKWEPVPQMFAQAGVYGGNPDRTYSGTRFQMNSTEGALLYFEAGYRINQETNRPGLEGSYRVGGYYHTGEFVDVYDGVTWAFYNAAGLPAPDVRNHQGTYGLYLLAEQQLYREKEKTDPAKEGLFAFFRLAGAPPDRSLAQFGVDGGLVYRGLIPGRDWDTLACGGSYLGISKDIRRAQRDANALVPGAFVVADHETAFELTYKIQATAWWTIQPCVQYVIHPGGASARPNATVFILQTTLRL